MRGQVRRVQLATKSRVVVVVESDAALDALPGTAVCMMIDETHGAPDTVVTIPWPTLCAVPPSPSTSPLSPTNA